ncbi:minus agglutinin [Gracilaria domingensis]|nr:minus agglutinin [Gracilaria domingensis]
MTSTSYRRVNDGAGDADGADTEADCDDVVCSSPRMRRRGGAVGSKRARGPSERGRGAPLARGSATAIGKTGGSGGEGGAIEAGGGGAGGGGRIGG